MERVGDYELVEVFARARPLTIHIARHVNDPARFVELVEVEELVDDVEEAYFMGDAVPALRALGEYGDPRLPRVLGATVRHDGRNYVPCAHAPSVSLRRLRERAFQTGGLAVPLIVALVVDVAEALSRVHGDARAHGSLGPDLLAASVDGVGRVVATMGERGYDASSTLGDVRALGAVLYELACGVPMPTRPDGPSALEVREDLPPELPWWIDRCVAPPSRTASARMVDVAEGLVRDLPWARWTSAQVADELRALVPYVVERATSRGT